MGGQPKEGRKGASQAEQLKPARLGAGSVPALVGLKARNAGTGGGSQSVGAATLRLASPETDRPVGTAVLVPGKGADRKSNWRAKEQSDREAGEGIDAGSAGVAEAVANQEDEGAGDAHPAGVTRAGQAQFFAQPPPPRGKGRTSASWSTPKNTQVVCGASPITRWTR